MIEDEEFSLVVKCGRHCGVYTKENSENGNQKATSEYGQFLSNINGLQLVYYAIFFF